MGFPQDLATSADRAGSWLCAGIDPDPKHYPAGLEAEDTLEFCLGVVEAVADVACAVKPNVAFFEALGSVGHEALAELIARVPPGLPVILDAKRGDVGHTAAKYAEAAFDELGADAVTVNPYLGRDGVEPFAAYEDKGVFLLCRTSNPSAGELQDLPIDAGGMPLYQAVARLAMQQWDQHGNLGLVAGATYLDELRTLRTACGDGVPILVPGVGKQGGDGQEALAAGSDRDGAFAIINVGRAIFQAGSGDDWRDQVAVAAQSYASQLKPVAADVES